VSDSRFQRDHRRHRRGRRAGGRPAQPTSTARRRTAPATTDNRRQRPALEHGDRLPAGARPQISSSHPMRTPHAS
jgi:hypothetical protein